MGGTIDKNEFISYGVSPPNLAANETTIPFFSAFTLGATQFVPNKEEEGFQLVHGEVTSPGESIEILYSDDGYSGDVVTIRMIQIGEDDPEELTFSKKEVNILVAALDKLAVWRKS